jgi:hypothetical protein
VLPDGVAVPVEPLQDAPIVFPITGLNGAVPRWCTTAAIGVVKSGAAGLPLPPVMVGTDEHAKPGLQVLSTVTNTAASAPQMASMNGAVTEAPLYPSACARG